MTTLTIHPILIHDVFNELRKAIEEGRTPKAVTFTEDNGRVGYSLN